MGLTSASEQILQHRREVYEKNGNDARSDLRSAIQTIPEFNPDSMKAFVDAVKKVDKQMTEKTDILDEIMTAIDLDAKAFNSTTSEVCSAKNEPWFHNRNNMIYDIYDI